VAGLPSKTRRRREARTSLTVSLLQPASCQSCAQVCTGRTTIRSTMSCSQVTRSRSVCPGHDLLRPSVPLSVDGVEIVASLVLLASRLAIRLAPMNRACGRHGIEPGRECRERDAGTVSRIISG
jgi:hypothetical protein